LLGKRIGNRRHELRVAALEADFHHATFARRHDVQFFQQQVGQPVAHGALAVSRLVELRDHGRALRQLQRIDHAQRHVLAGDDVDLGRHIAWQQLARHGQARQRIDAL
jgi:hypothetical protein